MNGRGRTVGWASLAVVFSVVCVGMAGAQPAAKLVDTRQAEEAFAGASAAGAPAAQQRDGRARAEGGLVGRWQGPESVIQINADGTLLIGQIPYRYTVQDSTLTLIGFDGTLPMPFLLQGDTLTVSINGQQAVLQRIAGAAASGASAPGGGTPGELAGKWCYMSNVSGTSGGGRMSDECFTIYADGTYQYHQETSSSGSYGSSASQQDDSGTWSLRGNTLAVVSRTQGATSYTLEKRNHPKNTNDPMLCLDGRCYVTYGPKPPWR